MSHPVLVLGDDAKAFLGVVRSLGRQGLEVHAAPADFTAPALRSRYLAALHRLPDYALGPERWVAALVELIEHAGIGLVVPTSDASLMMLLRHADTLGRERLVLPNAEAAAVFTDKAATRRLAFECGVPVCGGRTLAADDTAEGLAQGFGLPLVLKPRRSWDPGGVKWKRLAVIVRTRAALEAVLGQGLAEGWVVESFFAGEGVGLSVLARDGRILAAIQHRRLHQESETGPSSRRITEKVSPRLFAWSRDLVLATRLTGVAMFEYRSNRVMDEHVLLEVNPRFWGSLQLALAAGVDFPAMLCALGRQPPASTPPSYAHGVIKSDLSGEYGRLSRQLDEAGSPAARLRAGLAALAFLPRLCRKSAFDSWTADDPEPFFEERRQLLSRAGAFLAKRISRPAFLRSVRARPSLGRHPAARSDRWA